MHSLVKPSTQHHEPQDYGSSDDDRARTTQHKRGPIDKEPKYDGYPQAGEHGDSVCVARSSVKEPECLCSLVMTLKIERPRILRIKPSAALRASMLGQVRKRVMTGFAAHGASLIAQELSDQDPAPPPQPAELH